MRTINRAWLVLIVSILIGFSGLFVVGSVATAPASAIIGASPPDLNVEPVLFESASGSRISGWFLAGRPRRGAVVLMHGIRANRLSMLGRAKMLNRTGFSVLLFDFQAHGESPGRHITFGFLESLDATAAFDYLRRRMPQERIGVIGISLGGAAAILSEKPFDAAIIEAVFGSFDEALQNRLAMRIGALGKVLFPLLRLQVNLRLGFDPDLLRPTESVAALHAPLLLIAGSDDKHAILDEMKRIYARANEPKELWIIQGAQHVDFQRFSPAEYERRVLEFLVPRLAS